ncbi:hypothetical protein DMC30DRAFT_251976 [Rhodotorula diobovata]|uniref:Uncharacterized protein n=1 Tax=Rhodotorula diobovata TaxID=5288 RepID=A0A5C5FUQ0_9BASI|nr:hypothetical protein DMC30DRAFT_251976 [Rhodotorula diobovata]
MPTLSTLPLDVVRLIIDHLDPSPKRVTSEAPSISRARRDVGRRVALIARNFVDAGRDLVWRNVVVGFHRNPELLERILAEEWMAPHVRQLHLVIGKRDEPRALVMNLKRVLQVLDRLDGFILATTPQVADSLLSQLECAHGVANITYLDIDTTVSPSSVHASDLLDALQWFTGAERRIALSVRLVEGFQLPPLPYLLPSLRTRDVWLSIEELKPDEGHQLTAKAFIASYLSLFDPAIVQNVALVSDHLPFPTLQPFLFRAASSLTTLTLFLSRTDFPSLLGGIVELLPRLGALRRLKLALRAFDAQPLALVRADPLRRALGEALGRRESCVESVTLDVDFGPRTEVARWLEEEVSGGGSASGEGGKGALAAWRSVEWDSGLEMRREVAFAREVGADRKGDGARERWRLTEGESESEGEN